MRQNFRLKFQNYQREGCICAAILERFLGMGYVLPVLISISVEEPNLYVEDVDLLGGYVPICRRCGPTRGIRIYMCLFRTKVFVNQRYISRKRDQKMIGW